jgi:uncharacterized membrane protein YkgB
MMQGNLKLGLFILRLSVFIFFAIWAGEKFVRPESTIGIYSHFYLMDGLPVWGAYAIGSVQAIIIAAFMLGIAKFWSYGLLLVMHSLSTLSTWAQLISPYDPGHHLFVAGIPTLGAILFLFLMRDQDTLFNPFRVARETE